MQWRMVRSLQRVLEDMGFAMMHAFANQILVEDVEDGLVMLVGPDVSGRLLEIGVVGGTDGPVIVPAMQARARYLR